VGRKKILFINPVGHNSWDAAIKEYLEACKNDSTEVDVISLERGPHHLEYHFYEALIAADLLKCIKRAEIQGYDAAVIGCFYDPFLREAREICRRMVVTAPAESSLQLAGTLGNSFSIIVGRNKWIPAMRRNVLNYGYGEKLASFRSVGMGVLEFHEDENVTRARLVEEARAAVEQDRAECIILGCTIQFGFFRELQEIIGVPVIDVVLAPFKRAEYLVDVRDRFGWSVSRVGGFEPPPEEEIVEWGLEDQFDMDGLWSKS